MVGGGGRPIGRRGWGGGCVVGGGGRPSGRRGWSGGVVVGGGGRPSQGCSQGGFQVARNPPPPPTKNYT